MSPSTLAPALQGKAVQVDAEINDNKANLQIILHGIHLSPGIRVLLVCYLYRVRKRNFLKPISGSLIFRLKYSNTIGYRRLHDMPIVSNRYRVS